MNDHPNGPIFHDSSNIDLFHHNISHEHRHWAPLGSHAIDAGTWSTGIISPSALWRGPEQGGTGGDRLYRYSGSSYTYILLFPWKDRTDLYKLWERETEDRSMA